MFRRFVMLSIWLGALGCVPGKQPELMEATPPSSSPSPGSLVLRSAEPVWETIWAEGADNGGPGGVSINYEDIQYKTDAQSQSVKGPDPHWTLVFSEKAFEATRFPIWRITLEGINKIGFWWVRERDLDGSPNMLLSPKRYIETTSESSGTFSIDLSQHTEWSGNIVMVRIDPYADPSQSFALRRVEGWLSNGKWVAPGAPVTARVAMTPLDKAFSAFLSGLHVGAFTFGTDALIPAEKTPFSDDMTSFLKEKTLPVIESNVKQGHREQALQVVSLLARTSPNPLGCFADLVQTLPDDIRTALWKGDPYFVLRDFDRKDSGISVWNNAGKRVVQPPEIIKGEGPDGKACVRLIYGGAAAPGDTMAAIPIRAPVIDRRVGFRIFMKARQANEGLGFILAANYETLKTSGWLGRFRPRETKDGWTEYFREENFLTFGATLNNKDKSSVGIITLNSLLIPLVGAENELRVGPVEVYLPKNP